MAEPFNGILLVTADENGKLDTTAGEIKRAAETGTVVLFNFPDVGENFPGWLHAVTEPSGAITNYVISVFSIAVAADLDSGFGISEFTYEAASEADYPVQA